MALLADHAADRAEQMLALTVRLTALLEAETKLVEAHQPPLSGPEGEEKARLANVYRQELTRISEDRELIRAAPTRLLDRLRTETARFRIALKAHERALVGVKEVSEGLVRAIAEEIAKVRAGPQTYGASGGYATASTSSSAAVAISKTA
jgi:hypothetical protein